MPEVKFWRGNSGQISSQEIVDGQLLYNTDTGEVLIDVENRRVSCWEGLHPIGSWWLSDDPTSPAKLFGGTWEKLAENRTLIAAGGSIPVGATGGKSKHQITTEETPEHWHHSFMADPSQPASTSVNAITSDVITWTDRYRKLNIVHPTPPGAEMSLMQPYYATYIWQRIA